MYNKARSFLLLDSAQQKMITQQQWAGVEKLLDDNLSVRQTSLRTGISIPTIYKYIKTGGPNPPKHKEHNIAKELRKYKNFIDLRIKRGVYNALKLHKELEELGSTAKYKQVNNYVRLKVGSRRSNHSFHFQKSLSADYKPSTRHEKDPGEQAQVDWTYVKKTKINGKTERIYCFVYILSFSRMKYIEFMLRQNLRALVDCHIHAFETLGIPQQVVYDNMKTVVSERIKLPDGSTSIHLTSAIKDLAKHYGFEVAPTAPHHPRSKGKVERAIGYIKQNFLQGLKIGNGLESLDELNRQGRVWLDTIGNVKPNATTQERPVDRWEKEKMFLVFPVNIKPYQLTIFESIFCDKDATIDYNSCIYQLPPQFARKKIDFNESNQKGLPTLEFYFEGELITKHYLSMDRHRWIKETDAIFFKTSTKKKVNKRKRTESTPKQNKNLYPSIPQTPISYYNRIIFGTDRGFDE